MVRVFSQMNVKGRSASVHIYSTGIYTYHQLVSCSYDVYMQHGGKVKVVNGYMLS